MLWFPAMYFLLLKGITCQAVCVTWAEVQCYLMTQLSDLTFTI